MILYAYFFVLETKRNLAFSYALTSQESVFLEKANRNEIWCHEKEEEKTISHVLPVSTAPVNY